jgi:ribosomal protein S4
MNQMLQLKLDSLGLLLGMAPNRILSQELVKHGAFRVNGVVITDCQHSLNFDNILQLDLSIQQNLKALYNRTH